MADPNATTLMVRVISPERIMYEGEASLVVVPGAAGDFGVKPGHMALVSSLRKGVVAIGDEQNPSERIAVTSGIAEANGDSCTVLSQAAKSITHMTSAEAQEELRAAEEAVSNALTDDERKLAEKQLEMAQLVADSL